MSTSRLFTPLAVGKARLQHRIGMSPLTRYRATDDHVPTPLMVEYYAQRASVPGTLLVSEATFISKAQSGYDNVPGIWNEAQADGWRAVTDAVHARGAVIYCQLWALGRAAKADVARREGLTVLSASAVGLGAPAGEPRAMTADEIRQTVADYAAAARLAVERGGFDGVEIHGANGYLVDQFLQDTCNRRDDEWGGSVANRSRFAVEVVRAVADAVGADRTGIRLSPWSSFQGMRMADPVPQFSDVIRRLRPFGLAYLHLCEARVNGNYDVDAPETLDFALDLWDGVTLLAGGYDAARARRLVDEERPDKDIVVMFGRYFISNPDLPFRVQNGVAFTPYHRDTFYLPKSPKGYTDYPFSKEFLESTKGA